MKTAGVLIFIFSHLPFSLAYGAADALQAGETFHTLSESGKERESKEKETLHFSPNSTSELFFEKRVHTLGGVTGSVLGFGLGHGIQDRYFWKGAMFSVLDTLGWTMTILSCFTGVFDPPCRGCACEEPSLIPCILSAGFLLSARVYQSVDLWMYRFKTSHSAGSYSSLVYHNPKIFFKKPILRLSFQW